MAVEPVQPVANDKLDMQDYFDRFRKRTLLLIAVKQLAIILIIFGALQLGHVIELSLVMFVATSFISAVLVITVTAYLIQRAMRPFHDLIDAVVQTAYTQMPQESPKQTNKQYERDGFTTILKTVFELASHNVAQHDPDAQSGSVVTSGLDNTPTGIVIYNSNREMIYSNRSAPIGADMNSNNTLDIIFPENDTLTEWLDRNKDIPQAEYYWTRVSNKLPGEKDRRIFDVTANYKKGSNAEVVLTLNDRSASYMPQEDEFDFISFAAHELRGPITVIRGYLDVLSDELGPMMGKDQTLLIDRLVVSSNRLTTYINNILNAARFDRRHMKLHLSENKLASIYATISDDMELRASSQNRLLTVDIPDTLPTIASDNNSISEVLANLIDNGIKYSNEGGLVHVVARPVPGFIEVSITDRGIGVPVSVMPNLFHKFYRSHRSRETVAGTGIGLYICKAIVSSHGGSITARSIENEGSTFSFTVPIYDTVAEKLKANDNSNQTLIEHGSGWIRNHSMFRG